MNYLVGEYVVYCYLFGLWSSYGLELGGCA